MAMTPVVDSDATAKLQQISGTAAQPVENASRPRKPGTFDSARAREMSLRGHEAKRRRAEEFRQRVETAERDPAIDYGVRRLARVRAQLDALDRAIERIIENPRDSKGLKELVDAQTRLAEQERILAGRPLPGSRRPAREKAPRQEFRSSGPLD